MKWNFTAVLCLAMIGGLGGCNQKRDSSNEAATKPAPQPAPEHVDAYNVPDSYHAPCEAGYIPWWRWMRPEDKEKVRRGDDDVLRHPEKYTDDTKLGYTRDEAEAFVRGTRIIDREECIPEHVLCEYSSYNHNHVCNLREGPYILQDYRTWVDGRPPGTPEPCAFTEYRDASGHCSDANMDVSKDDPRAALVGCNYGYRTDQSGKLECKDKPVDVRVVP